MASRIDRGLIGQESFLAVCGGKAGSIGCPAAGGAASAAPLSAAAAAGSAVGACRFFGRRTLGPHHLRKRLGQFVQRDALLVRLERRIGGGGH